MTVQNDVSMDDSRYIEQVRNGDKEAYSFIVKKYMKKAYYIALHFVKSEADAWDISQDAFIKAFRHLKKFQTDRAFFPWFYRLLKNICLDWVKKQKKRNETSLEEVAPFTRCEDDFELKLCVRRGIEQLPPEQKEIIALRYFQGFSYREIAEILEKPIGSVMSQLYYAKRLLREKMENPNHEP